MTAAPEPNIDLNGMTLAQLAALDGTVLGDALVRLHLEATSDDDDTHVAAFNASF